MKTEFSKPLKLKPNLYMSYVDILQPLLYGKGYYAIVHGSVNRDLDLIIIPISDTPEPELEVVKFIDMTLTGTNKPDATFYRRSRTPGGRIQYIIELGQNITRSGILTNFYMDIKFVPLVLNN